MDDDHFADLPRNAGHNVGGEGQEAPERLLAEVRVAQVHSYNLVKLDKLG